MMLQLDYKENVEKHLKPFYLKYTMDLETLNEYCPFKPLHTSFNMNSFSELGWPEPFDPAEILDPAERARLKRMATIAMFSSKKRVAVGHVVK